MSQPSNDVPEDDSSDDLAVDGAGDVTEEGAYGVLDAANDVEVAVGPMSEGSTAEERMAMIEQLSKELARRQETQRPVNWNLDEDLMETLFDEAQGFPDVREHLRREMDALRRTLAGEHVEDEEDLIEFAGSEPSPEDARWNQFGYEALVIAEGQFVRANQIALARLIRTVLNLRRGLSYDANPLDPSWFANFDGVPPEIAELLRNNEDGQNSEALREMIAEYLRNRYGSSDDDENSEDQGLVPGYNYADAADGDPGDSDAEDGADLSDRSGAR